MSSSAFRNIYVNAAAIVRAKLSEQTGIEELLSELGKRVPDEDEDPRRHRELFFEPRIDAQQIGVPVETAELAAVLLHRIGVFRLWVRVACPDVEDHEVGTILETDDPTEFEQLAAASCDYCGRHHDLGWENCETVYAFSTRLDQNEQQFDYSRLKSVFRSPQQVSGMLSFSDQSRCEILTQQVKRDMPFEELLVLTLRSNHDAQEVPAPFRVWKNAWVGPGSILVAYMLLIIPIEKFVGERLAWGVTVVVVVVVFLVIRGQVQANLAPTAVQRTAMFCGFPISAFCITAGATGLHINAGAGEGQPWWTRLEFGEQSTLLIVAGVILFIAMLLFVWAYDYSRGWLELRTRERE